MAGAATQFKPRELLIHTPDGKTRTLALERERYTLGRSSTNELCYADDAGLSRQHMVLEKSGETWTVQDLNSKNGTFVNGVRIEAARPLGPSDRITAGHLTLEFAEKVPTAPANTVIFVEPNAPSTAVSTTVATSLEGLLADEKKIEGGAAMKALIRAGRELAGNMPLDDLFKLIMDLSIDAVGAARGVLMTVEGEELVVRAARGEGFRISRMVRDRVINEKTSLLVRDARLDQAFAERMSIVQQQIRSMLAVPLQTDDRVIGLIYLDSPHFVHEFTRDDLNLLTVMANVAAIRIEHTRLAEVEAAERLLAKDLAQAAEIQMRLLPTKAPDVPGIDLAGYNAACRTVGGDYYDFFEYPSGRVAMILGDVSGKGMAASLMMMGLQARAQVLIDEPENLAATMTRLNRITAANCPPARFITAFLCILDSATGDLVYTNAGHNAPIIMRKAGGYTELGEGGPPLGILANCEYQEFRTRLESGDTLIIYSDGVTEASSPQDEEFEIENLSRAVLALGNVPAKELIAGVIDEIAKFTVGAPPADDVTLIVARRGLPGPSLVETNPNN
jgi:phosphoserine phosphatase RsbU/P